MGWEQDSGLGHKAGVCCSSCAFGVGRGLRALALESVQQARLLVRSSNQSFRFKGRR